MNRSRPSSFPDGPARAVVSQLQRLGLHPGAAWALSWLAVIGGGLVFDHRRTAAEAVVACILGALFGALSWVGALGFAGRRAPLWIVPGVAALGVARGAVYAGFGEGAAGAASLAFEPFTLLAAALVVWRAELIEDELGPRLWLAGALIALAALEVADGLVPLGVAFPDTTPYWFSVGLLAAAGELWAMRSWNARRELRLERAEDEQRKLEEEIARERRTNLLLQRSEAWLFDFFEKAPDLLLVLAPGSHEILRCNRRFSEALGIPRRELIGRSLLALVAPDTAEALRALLAGGRRRLRNLHLHLVRRDGGELVVLANLAQRTDPSGADEIRAVLHDVTRLQQGKGHEFRDLYRTLARELGAGVFHADDEGRCRFVNASFCELTGLSPGDAEERSWLRMVHREDRPWLEPLWAAAVRDRTVFRAEHRIQPIAGNTVRVVTECTPISDRAFGGFAGAMTRLPASTQPAASRGETARGDGPQLGAPPAPRGERRPSP